MPKSRSQTTYRCCFCGESIDRGPALVEIEWGRCPLTLPEEQRYPQQIANYTHLRCLTDRLHQECELNLVPGGKPTPLNYWPSEQPACCFCGEPCPLDTSLLKIRVLHFEGGRATIWSHRDCLLSRKQGRRGP
jgi:hypothetical protein